ncbi:hypothetical protein Ahy_B01g052898 [Arachis hypogaea]|uniref:Aminotransferase-like plant mobile domain-containing protein n=1 Tax=Arachis hypogaea TaxID=3818 RepID=A0A445AQL6_ARAHY|nr:hypothetical protein Ahy_B01g052898 [Arachis hypogaea]
MPLHDRIIPYLERAGLYHLARLNSEWFWLDEPLVSAFVERWRPETHTFHLPFRECTVTLQDVAFQLGLPVDGEAVSGCLGEFETYMEGGRPAWKWFEDLFGIAGGSAALAWLYRCMCRVANRNVTNLAGPLQLLQSWIFWRFPSLRPEGFETFSFPLASRWSAYLPPNDGKEQRVIRYRLALDRLTARDLSFIAIVWEPYSALDVLAVVHPEILTEEHSRLWRAVTSLIYFAVIEWHQVDRVVPQLGGVQHIPEDGLNVDWLYAKDGRGGDRWFPHYYQVWHLHWGNRLDAVISIDRVADPGPSANYLDWWFREAQQFLSPGAAFADPRGTQIPPEAFQRGSSQEDDAGGEARAEVDHRVRRSSAKRGRTVDPTQFGVGVSGTAASQAGGGTFTSRSYSPMPEPSSHMYAQPETPTMTMDLDDQLGEYVVDLNMPAGSPLDTWFTMGGTPQSAIGLDHPGDDIGQQAARPTRVRRPAQCGTGSHLLGDFHDAARDDRDD